MEEEVNQKVVSLTVRTGKLTAGVLARAMRDFLDSQKAKPHKYAKGKQSFPVFLRELAKRTLEGGTVPVPMVAVEGDLFSGMDPEKINAGDEFTLKEQVRLRMDTMTDPEGKLWMPLFLNMDELEKGETANVRMEVMIMDILKAGLDRNDVEGVVVNPFDKPFVFGKNMLGHFIGNMEFISKREIV